MKILTTAMVFSQIRQINKEIIQGFASLYAITLIGFLIVLSSFFITIIVSQIRFSYREELTTKAIFLAESGLERGIYKYLIETTEIPPRDETNCYVVQSYPDGSSFCVYVVVGSEDPGDFITLRSYGRFLNIERIVEIDLPKR